MMSKLAYIYFYILLVAGLCFNNPTYGRSNTRPDNHPPAGKGVSTSAAGEAVFNPKIIQDERGDVPVISVHLTNTTQATVYLGSQDLNYKVQLLVIDTDGDGVIKVGWNTDQAGQASAMEVFNAAEKDGGTAIEIATRLTESFSDPTMRLNAAQYPLAAYVNDIQTDAGTVDLRDANQVERNLLEQRAQNSLEIQNVLPNLAVNDTVAEGDYLAIKIHSAGLFGYIDSTANLAGSGTQGVTLSITETDASAGSSRPETISATDFTGMVKDPAHNNLYLVARTDTAPFSLSDQELSKGGVTYRATFMIDYLQADTVANPYVNEDKVLKSTFSIVPRSVDVPTSSDGKVHLKQATGQYIEGTTPLADGNLLNISLQNTDTAPFLRSKSDTVSNGTIRKDFDLSDIPNGTSFSITVTEESRTLAELTGIIIAPDTIKITENISVSDQVDVLPPKILTINEDIPVSDSIQILPPENITVREQIGINDSLTVQTGKLIVVHEQIAVNDSVNVIKPVVINIPENITVSDTVGITLPQIVKISEIISVSDTVSSKVATSLVDRDGSETPDEFKLHTNYPNPFNPTTTIQFDLPKAAHVSLNIYNLNGARVARLIDKKMTAGKYAVKWKADQLASGVYIYRIKAGPFESTQRMTLLK